MKFDQTFQNLIEGISARAHMAMASQNRNAEHNNEQELLNTLDQAYMSWQQSGGKKSQPFSHWFIYDPKGVRFFTEIVQMIANRNQ